VYFKTVEEWNLSGHTRKNGTQEGRGEPVALNFSCCAISLRMWIAWFAAFMFAIEV